MPSASLALHGLPSWYYLCTFFAALAVVVTSTPIVRAIALNFGYVDLPSARKVHRQPIPRIGGIAIFVGTAVALLIVYLLGGMELLTAKTIPGILGVSLGSVCFFLIGLTDDLIGLSPIARLLLQCLVASLAWLIGVQIEFLTIPGLGLVQLGWLSLPMTVIWLAGVVNAINWIDGLDGLASGVSGIAATVIFVICLYTGQPAGALLVLALAGSLLGFLVYNFNPARIFMGDGGSYFIGFLLAGVSAIDLVKGATATAILLPILILAIPILDMSVVIFVRLRKGCSPFIADKQHLHHRLLKAGLSHRSTVFVIYAMTLWVGSLAIAFAGIPSSPVILGSATGILAYMIWKAWRSIRQSES
jgi:UDP-N-acetylmuramyl pentapeptide phosphotransferase/UDP-N-acetylglucosamine-1-phosphate transferase